MCLNASVVFLLHRIYIFMQRTEQGALGFGHGSLAASMTLEHMGMVLAYSYLALGATASGLMSNSVYKRGSYIANYCCIQKISGDLHSELVC